MESLTGTIERVTFHTEDTGYSVLRVKVPGRSEPVTVTGKTPSAHAGERVEAQGEWVNMADYGRQFQAETISVSPPSSREGMERYLASGLIEGIGPVYAKKLIEKFGDDIFNVIETSSARLQEVPGVGAKRRREIKAGWEKQKSVRSIMVFLHSHGVSTGKAVKIFQAYGENALHTVRNDPYRLAGDIHGIGFQSADAIAQSVGLAPDSPKRLAAGLDHVLRQAGNEGHCALPRAELLTRAVVLLDTPDPAAPEAVLDDALLGGRLVSETIDGTELIFPPPLAKAEAEIARRLAALSDKPAAYPALDADKALEWVARSTGQALAAGQEAAVRRALASRVLIITGGPGVGKTTILRSVLAILGAKGVTFQLAAPTGRAARRMAESTGHEAKTIHRLLEYQPGGSGFQKNASNPLKGDLFVLDEASMVDVSLMSAWLRAVPDTGHVLLTGDADQLPSVGPGSVLRDMIQSGAVPVVRLTEIFRQAAESGIITAAHAINAGHMPDLPKPAPPGSDFHFIERDTPEDTVDTILTLVRERIPRAFGLDPIADVQVLCPMNRGSLGTETLNARLREALNPGDPMRPECDRFGRTFRAGDKVIQTRNNYDKEVFNGDIGRVTGVEADPLRVDVRFEDGRAAVYEAGDLDELRPAWAITIHKSQGSEFPAVILPLAMQHYMMLRRNLLYTGVTRGRKLVVLVGERKALETAVRQADGAKRWTGLLSKLRGNARI